MDLQPLVQQVGRQVMQALQTAARGGSIGTCDSGGGSGGSSGGGGSQGTTLSEIQARLLASGLPSCQASKQVGGWFVWACRMANSYVFGCLGDHTCPVSCRCCHRCCCFCCGEDCRC